MKKSHRKDVIIARIIFACMVLILIAIIVFGVKAVVKYRADRQPQQEPDVISTQTEQPDTDSESESVEPAADDNEQWIIDDTENTEATEPTEETEAVGESGDTEGTDASGQVQLKAQYSVNIRSGAGKDFPVVGGVEAGGIILLLEDEGNGWGYIQRDDLTGYVYLDYFQVIDGADE
jgi:cytoskeletal protein RodZ